MTSIIKNQIVKQLARFTKNLSPSKISLKFLKGEGELRNLELNEKFLTDLLELPPFIRLTRAVCNKISAKIHWTRLKTDPIQLFLDCVEVDMEMIENVSEDFHLQQPPTATNQTTREKPSEYGFAEKVVDGMHVTINSVVMAFKTPTFRATFQMSHLSVHSTDPSWEKASLRNTRIKDELGKEVLTFKQITFGTLRIDADALYKSGQEDSSPLRVITSAAKVNIVIKKKIEDCSVVAARLHLICDDILWVLTHAQLQAVAGFAKSVVQVVEKCKKSEPAPSVASDDSSQSSNSPNENWSEHISTTDHSNETPSSLFEKEDVTETSYRITTSKIDIHLCDDTPIEKSFMGGGGQSGGSMQIVVTRLSFEHYPYHLAFTSRTHWPSHNEASLTRAHWVQELFNSFKKTMKEDSRKTRRKPQVPEQGLGNAKYARPSQDSGMNKNVVMATDGVPKKPSRVYLYECAFVISCDEFLVMPITTNDMSSTSNIPFLCSYSKSLNLPINMPTLQFDYTLYFYPGQEDAKVPQPNLFCQINPLHLTMDNVTCIWFHRFMQSIRLGFAWAEEIIAAQETEPRHIDVRIEGLMPKLTLPLPSDPDQVMNSFYKQYRPQALQIQMSSFRVSNTRVGLEFKQSDLVNTLEVFLKSELYGSNEVFPNNGIDVKPLPQMAWLNDFSLCASMTNIENIYEENIMSGDHSVVWMLNARQCWCDFVGIEETHGRPRPFIEPFPLNMCMCYPIARVNYLPAQLSIHEQNMPSEPSQNTSLHRSPSDPYCKQSKPYRKTSSTKSTPLSSPGFAKIHKSRSAASVNIPVLSSDCRDNTMRGLSPNVSESGSEESMSSFTEESVMSGSVNSISSNTVGNDKVASSSNNRPGDNTSSREDSRGSSVCRPMPFVNSTSGIESDGSSDSCFDKDSPRSKFPDGGQEKSECSLSILLNIPRALAIKLDHYQFVFLMRLQESFVTLRDVLFADLEKFDVQRRKMLGKDSGEIGADETGILVSLVSKGAEVVLLVPAPTFQPESERQDENGAEPYDRDPSQNVMETLEMTEVENDLKAMKDYQFSPRDNEKLLETDDESDHFNEVTVGEDTVMIESNTVTHRRNGSESSSNDTSTFGSDYSLLTTGTGSERSYEGRDTSAVTITGRSFECSVAMKGDDFAFKLLACGCEVSESHHENLEVYLNQKSKIRKDSNTMSNGCGELRLRYAMGSSIDETMKGAAENGVANLMLSDVLVRLLMSNVDGLLECVQDEVEVSLPFMPVKIDLKNLRLNITSDTPPRLLSLPPSLPLNVHIDQGTITRTGEGEVQINFPKGHTTQQNLHRTHEGHLITSDEMIERLRQETNEMTARVSSIRSENVSLLNKLQVADEVKDSLKTERDRLMVTVERLTEELVKSNREHDKMQEVIRHLQRSDQT